jgi:hypothetical protein
MVEENYKIKITCFSLRMVRIQCQKTKIRSHLEYFRVSILGLEAVPSLYCEVILFIEQQYLKV